MNRIIHDIIKFFIKEVKCFRKAVRVILFQLQ